MKQRTHAAVRNRHTESPSCATLGCNDALHDLPVYRTRLFYRFTYSIPDRSSSSCDPKIYKIYEDLQDLRCCVPPTRGGEGGYGLGKGGRGAAYLRAFCPGARVERAEGS